MNQHSSSTKPSVSSTENLARSQAKPSNSNTSTQTSNATSSSTAKSTTQTQTQAQTPSAKKTTHPTPPTHPIKPPKKKLLSTKYSLLLSKLSQVLIYCILATIIILTGWALWKHQPWKTFKLINISQVGAQATSQTSTPAQDSELAKLTTKVTQLEQLVQQQLSKLQQQQTEQIKTLQQQTDQFIRTAEMQMNNHELLINQWKKHLAKPEKLVDTIHNHLKLIQLQIPLSYAPHLLSGQIQYVDQLLAELSIAELSTLRIELQNIIETLEDKPSVPISLWLGHIELARQSIPLWLTPTDSATAKKPTNATNDSPDSTNSANTTSSLEHLLKLISDKLTHALSFSKTTKTEQSPLSTQQQLTQAVQLTDLEKTNILKQQLNNLSISIMARNWSQLNQQAKETEQWLQNHLPIPKQMNYQSYQKLIEILSTMRLYQPSSIQISMAKALKILNDYKNKLK